MITGASMILLRYVLQEVVKQLIVYPFNISKFSDFSFFAFRIT